MYVRDPIFIIFVFILSVFKFSDLLLMEYLPPVTESLCYMDGDCHDCHDLHLDTKCHNVSYIISQHMGQENICMQML